MAVTVRECARGEQCGLLTTNPTHLFLRSVTLGYVTCQDLECPNIDTRAVIDEVIRVDENSFDFVLVPMALINVTYD